MLETNFRRQWKKVSMVQKEACACGFESKKQKKKENYE